VDGKGIVDARFSVSILIYRLRAFGFTADPAGFIGGATFKEAADANRHSFGLLGHRRAVACGVGDGCDRLLA
jgi:hypothetical protein